MARYTDYEARVASTGIASWYKRPTIRGLMSTLSTTDGELLRAQASALATRLGGLPTPGAKEAFLHHALQLSGLIDQVAVVNTYEDRARTLDAMYMSARKAWQDVASQTGMRNRAEQWLSSLQGGLRAYAAGEGWTL